MVIECLAKARTRHRPTHDRYCVSADCDAWCPVGPLRLRFSSMYAMPVMLVVLAALAIAYRYYSAFLAARVAVLDDTRITPAHEFNDGQNYHPTHKWVLFGHHFAAISRRRAADRSGAGHSVWLSAGIDLAGRGSVSGRRRARHAGAGGQRAPRRTVAGRDCPRRDRARGGHDGIDCDTVRRRDRAFRPGRGGGQGAGGRRDQAGRGHSAGSAGR